jgi:hypothetical protein
LDGSAERVCGVPQIAAGLDDQVRLEHADECEEQLAHLGLGRGGGDRRWIEAQVSLT